MWRGRTAASEVLSFGNELDRTWISRLTALPDNIGALTLYRVDGDEAEFLVITMWSRKEPHVSPPPPEGMVLDAHVTLGSDYEYFVRGNVALGVGMLAWP